MMNDTVLCLTALFLLGWVTYLKYEIGLLRGQMEELTQKLKKLSRAMGQEVQTGGNTQVWGQRPSWLK